MDIARYYFLVPSGLAFIFIVFSTAFYNKKYKFVLKQKRFFNFLYKRLDIFVPGNDSRIFKFYSNLIRFTNLTVEKIIKIKICILILTCLLCVLIKLTNISIYTKDIINKFDYQCDLIYQSKPLTSEYEAMKQEIYYFRVAIANINKTDCFHYKKEELQNKIKTLIDKDASELFLPKDTLSNKLYYRVFNYYQCRRLEHIFNNIYWIQLNFYSGYFLNLSELFCKS